MLNIKYRFLLLYIKLVVVKVIKVGGAILKNEKYKGDLLFQKTYKMNIM